MKKANSKKIAIIGSGIVGQATGKGLARAGHNVLFYDKNPNIIKTLKNDGYHADHIENLSTVETDEIEIFMISVPTPTKEGRVELSFLNEALTSLGKAIKETEKNPIFVVRSTVPPGTTENLAVSVLEKESGKKAGKDFGICMNPEFLREVSAEKDFMNPWMVVIGCDDKSAGLALAKIYKIFKCPIVHMSLKEAEMMKYAHNLLNATKISFFNEMRLVGDKMGVDSEVFFPAVVKSAEAMWNPEYGTKNFGPYGGVCLPKDTEAFFTWALEVADFEMPVLKGTIATNKLMQESVTVEQQINVHAYHIVPALKNNFLQREFSKKTKNKNTFQFDGASSIPL